MTTKELRKLNKQTHLTFDEVSRLEKTFHIISEQIKDILKDKIIDFDIFNSNFTECFKIFENTSDDVKYFKRVSHPINIDLVYSVIECVLLENDIKLISMQFVDDSIYISYTMRLNIFDKLRKLINKF